MAIKNIWKLQTMVILMGVFMALPAWAVQPVITYQGNITDQVGNPINDKYATIIFRLWDDPLNQPPDFKPLWEEVHYGIVVADGIINETLGEREPLPAGSEVGIQDLWLEVEYEGELMTPRLALSSVAGALYAEKAGDADTVGGRSAADLVLQAELADHSALAGAHHAKTTSFTELTDQAADGQIPAAITRDTELNSHAGNSFAHHSRYTNAEAVVAVLAADGPGSTLNADLLDGQQAASFATADHGHSPTCTTRLSAVTNLDSWYTSISASCNAGETLVSGGFSYSSWNSGSNCKVIANHKANETTWRVTWGSPTQTECSAYSARTYAVCCTW